MRALTLVVLVVLLQPSVAFANDEEASYDLLFCYDGKQKLATRSLRYEGCREGSELVDREEWLDLGLKSEQLTEDVYRRFKGKVPERTDSRCR